ncbi:hypothetical protein RHSIM_Rhsim01G0124400 [Rhododendron simsii]|uniref:Uncharacterized protein n=1 Tax=Rhododendron simsii TaxID=118357 RepID=A0A834HFE3_RHOSS|nr:hypothetical protein RHSIM_Rhsim01G0124400 [Rhododendron simsii]
MANSLLDDVFTVQKLDPDGKKFDKVSRIEASSSDQQQFFMQLDVNTDIYKLQVGDKFNMVLAATLNLDGTPDSGYFTQPQVFWTQPSMEAIGNKFMAKVVSSRAFNYFRAEGSHLQTSLIMLCMESCIRSQMFQVHQDLKCTEMLFSFGGLLMLLQGDSSDAKKLELDQRLFLLMKKV